MRETFEKSETDKIRVKVFIHQNITSYKIISRIPKSETNRLVILIPKYRA